ncbi:Lys63-specific deubiquitinase [Aureococcus anophagefferens]|nr:Lys63-specific deubiquitinase [Aureococcus anophagefferens]
MASAEAEPAHLFQVLRCKKLSQASCYVVVTHGDDEIGRTPTVKVAADPVVFPPLASTFAVPRGAEQLAVKLVAPGALGDTPVGTVRVSWPSSSTTRPRRSQMLPELVVGRAAADGAKVQVRALVRRRKPTPQAAPEKAPSMRRLTCGPGLDGGLLGLGLFASDSEEAVVSMMDRAVAPVTLHVYDVGRSVHTGRINPSAPPRAGGVFHGAIEVYGKEFTFAGSNKAMPGIFSSNPRKCPFHTYRESIYLGDCGLTRRQTLAILHRMAADWMAPTYNLLLKNCCFFCKEFALELGVGTIPGWVYELAKVGAGLQVAFGSKPLPVLPTPQAHAASVSPLQTPRDVLLTLTSEGNLGEDDGEDDDDASPYRLSVDPGEALVDNRMAARITAAARAKMGQGPVPGAPHRELGPARAALASPSPGRRRARSARAASRTGSARSGAASRASRE